MKRRFLKIIKWAFAAALLIAAATVALSYRTIKKSLGRVQYNPSIQKKIRQNRTRFSNELDAQHVSFVSSDGTKLQGFLVVRKNARHNILVCHGYRSAKELLFDFAQMFPKENFLFFDFRAHGQSTGDLITLGYNEKKDALAALNFLKTDERTKNLPIYGIGMSMGGVALLAAAVEKPVLKGLVIDSAFTSLEDQIALSFYRTTGLPRYPFLPITRWLFELLTGVVVSEVDAVRYVRSLHIPLLFIHARGDVEVPLESVYALYAAAHGEKELWIEGPCKHATICRNYRDEYATRVRDFFGF